MTRGNRSGTATCLVAAVVLMGFGWPAPAGSATGRAVAPANGAERRLEVAAKRAYDREAAATRYVHQRPAIVRGVPHRLTVRAFVTPSASHLAGSARRTALGERKAMSPRSPREATVNINPGKATTLAGDGTNASKNGTGTAAEFRDMGGIVVVSGFAYVATTARSAR